MRVTCSYGQLFDTLATRFNQLTLLVLAFWGQSPQEFEWFAPQNGTTVLKEL